MDTKLNQKLKFQKRIKGTLRAPKKLLKKLGVVSLSRDYFPFIVKIKKVSKSQINKWILGDFRSVVCFLLDFGVEIFCPCGKCNLVGTLSDERATRCWLFKCVWYLFPDPLDSQLPLTLHFSVALTITKTFLKWFSFQPFVHNLHLIGS